MLNGILRAIDGLDGIAFQVLVTICFVAGLELLRRAWRLELKVIGCQTPLCTLFLAMHHLLFGLGALGIALLGNSELYYNPSGFYLLTTGVGRLVVIELVALAAGYGGIRLYASLAAGRDGVGSLVRGRGGRGTSPQWNRELTSSQIEYVCISGIWLYVGVIVVTFGSSFGSFNEGSSQTWANWLGNGLLRVLPGVFLIVGFHWYRLSRFAHLLAWLALVFAMLIYIPVGDRTGQLLPFALLFFGLLLNSGVLWEVKRNFVIVMVLLGLVRVFLGGRLELVRTYVFPRDVTGFGEIVDRIGPIFALMLDPYFHPDVMVGYAGADDWAGAELLRFSVRIINISAPSIMSLTPDEIPFAGWTSDDWERLVKTSLPGMSAYWHMENEKMLLLTYGWNINPDQGHSMPVTLLADAWRRFGLTGVLGTYFPLGFMFTAIAKRVGRDRRALWPLIFGAGFSTAVVQTYAFTILETIVYLARNGVLAIVIALTVDTLVRGRTETVAARLKGVAAALPPFGIRNPRSGAGKRAAPRWPGGKEFGETWMLPPRGK